jgi:AAHS family 4-hydroxybenzoate transporter-like MFS transporter
MPNATALVGEHSPPGRRIAAMMIVTNGFMVGAVLGGLVSAWLIPAHGWRAVFRVGGVVPLAILVPMWRWLPESPQFLEARRRRGIPLFHLFRAGRVRRTALLWTVSFMNVLNAFFVASWLPTVVRDAGHPTSTAVLVGTAVQVGGAVGTFALGGIVQRVGIVRVLVACFAVAAANLAVVAEPWVPLGALVGVAFLLGWGIFAGQPGVNALAASCYPTELRSTGVGAALAVGRFGAFLGPLAASELMVRGWSNQQLFRAAAVPALISVAVILALGRALPRGGPAG